MTSPQPAPADDVLLAPKSRAALLDLAKFMGMSGEADALRGDLRTERILPRLKRVLGLLGLPISTGRGVPGIVVTLLPSAAASWPAGSVAVEWRPSAELTALEDDCDLGDAVDHFTRSAGESLETALTAILRKSGLHVIIDSQFRGVIVADTRPVDHLEALQL
ncbi:hypothetical protein ACWC5I_17385 [Kitasatospora sp. NPDC001574]